MSYNTLANSLCTKSMYPRASVKCLNWRYRWSCFRNELRNSKAHCITLQKIDEPDYFIPFLKSIGYSVSYLKRSGDKKDGLLSCYRSDMFQLEEEIDVQYNIKPCSFMDRDNIALVLVLRDRRNDQRFILSNTHILFNPKRGDIKLNQVLYLFNHIEMLQCKYEINHLIITGDFNSTPNSAIYHYITKER
jgi:protein angel